MSHTNSSITFEFGLTGDCDNYNHALVCALRNLGV